MAPHSLDKLGYESCPHCRCFFKRLGNHTRKCASRPAAPSVPPPAQLDLDDPIGFLPDIREVFAGFRPTLSFVPHAHRQAWGRVLCAALDDVIARNSIESWTRLLMLPKCVLTLPKRAGRRNRGDNHTVTDLCEAWERGEQEWLWKQSIRSPRLFQSGSDTRRTMASAIQHARHGRLGKACSTLSSSGLAPTDSSTLLLMQGKHPQSDPPEPVEPTATPPLQLGADFNLFATLTSFAKDVGTDSSNFRIQHLLDAAEAHLPSPYIPRLKKIINLLLSGKACENVRLVLAGARLTALRKGDSDVRPIAAGNIFRRIASKCACVLLQKQIQKELKPLQFGVACPGGAELIIHTMRDSLAVNWDTPDFVVLKVDFANAFNSVCRRTLLVECRSLFPELLPWVEWCYASQPLLFFGDSMSLKSCVGVQQGDPLGPMLFCLVLQVLARRIGDECPGLLFNKWYLDDGVLAGPSESVAQAVRILSHDGPQLGLILNLSKCELFSSELGNFAFDVLDPGLGHLHFPNEIRRSSSPNFVLLGSPVGDVAFCSTHVQNLRLRNKKLLDSLCLLEDSQVALHLLRTCASFCKYVYIARTTPPQLVRSALATCDVDIRTSFERFAALQLTAAAWQQAQLALSVGGLGLRSTARHCSAAFIASHTRAMPGVMSMSLNSAITFHAEVLDAPILDTVVARWMAHPPEQRSLSAKLERLDQAALLAVANPGNRIRLNSVSSAHSSAWLQAIPARGPIDLCLSSDEMQVALQHRLGLSLAAPGDTCSVCDKDPPRELDVLGHHHVTCSTGGFVTVRHNRLRDNFNFLCYMAGLTAQKEKGASHGDLSRPADLLVSDWSLGKSAAFDFTIVSPLVSDNLHLAGGLDVVERAAALKHQENDDKCDDLGWVCIPMAVDTYGRWCEEAHTAFASIASNIHTRTKASLAASTNSVYNALGIVLARQNARAILARRAVAGTREVLQLALCAHESL